MKPPISLKKDPTGRYCTDVFYQPRTVIPTESPEFPGFFKLDPYEEETPGGAPQGSCHVEHNYIWTYVSSNATPCTPGWP